MSMQIHGPSESLTAADIHAYVNSPGFVVLKFGPIRFYLDDPQQFDWLIIAATEGKQLLVDNPAEPEDDEPEPAGEGGVLFPAGDEDQPASSDAAGVLAASIASGTPLLVTDDEAEQVSA